MSERQEQLTVELSLPMVRLDTFLREKFPAASRGALQRLIEEGHIRVNGKAVKATTPDDVQSLWNSIPMAGLPVTLRHASGATMDVLLKEGPIYPLFDQYGPID